MKLYSVSLAQVLEARDRRAAVQNMMLADAGPGRCLICLTLNIAGDVKRTPMTHMLFTRGVKELEALDLRIEDSLLTDEPAGSEGFWLADEDPAEVKKKLEAVEDSFPAARLFDFDVLTEDGTKLSRNVSRRCLICDAPAAECARSRRHGLDAVKAATDRLLRQFCADELAKAAHDSLLDELYTTPKPGLVDLMSCGAHKDMDIPLFEKSADALVPYFRDAVLMGMDCCEMADLRRRGLKAEQDMFKATGGVNTHKGVVYSMGLLLAGMGRRLTEGGDCLEHAADFARRDAEEYLREAFERPVTNGGAAYRRYGAGGAAAEAAAGFPGADYCFLRLIHYRNMDCVNPAALAFCDVMARLEDTNLLHRGGEEGLEYARQSASEIAAMPEPERIKALEELDAEMISRNLSPGGSADILALALMIDRWQSMQ
jgi:holo-ACP synthase/triphosphoribosyl-dephospho-CoA synthase